MTDVVTKAADYARAAHESIDQRRKFTNEPYIVHPQAVAAWVASVTTNPAVIAAAWLHDVVEDTPVTIDQIESDFGPEIARLVADLTDVSQKSDGNRQQRTAIDRKHTSATDPRAKTVKLADLIDNLSDMHPWLSDSICRAVTGDGDVRRKLYTDGEHTVFAFRRCICLNGIDLGATRGDLAERMLPITLERISESKRRSVDEIWARWKQQHARILGAILDLAVQVIAALPSVELE